MRIEVRIREYLSSELAPPAMPSMRNFIYYHIVVLRNNNQTLVHPQGHPGHPKDRKVVPDLTRQGHASVYLSTDNTPCPSPSTSITGIVNLKDSLTNPIGAFGLTVVNPRQHSAAPVSRS